MLVGKHPHIQQHVVGRSPSVNGSAFRGSLSCVSLLYEAAAASYRCDAKSDKPPVEGIGFRVYDLGLR